MKLLHNNREKLHDSHVLELAPVLTMLTLIFYSINLAKDVIRNVLT